MSKVIGIDPGKNTGLVCLKGDPKAPSLVGDMTIKTSGSLNTQARTIIELTEKFILTVMPDIVVVEWPGEWIRKGGSKAVHKLWSATEWIRCTIINLGLEKQSEWPDVSNANTRGQIDNDGVYLIPGLFEKMITSVGTPPLRTDYKTKSQYQTAKRKYRKDRNIFIAQEVLGLDELFDEHRADAFMLAWYGLRKLKDEKDKTS